jgi:hypothetical protein|tara:strand:+ start:7819 stop:8394 length:576 start_codon:yes stop_codon:yes gene_type:complete
MADKKNAKTKSTTKKVAEKKPRYATLEPQVEEEEVVEEKVVEEKIVNSFSTEKVTKKAPKKTVEDEEVLKEKARAATVAAAEKANQPKEVKRYETKILIKKEPIAKNIYAATYGYHETTGELSILQGENGAYGADIENLFNNDIIIIDKETGAKSVVSRTENPKLWIQSLYKAELGKPYIAEEARSFYETE